MEISAMRVSLPWIAVGLAIFTASGSTQASSAAGSYQVQKTARVGGEGGFDYVYADADGRRLYIARSGPTPRVTVFDLDTLEPAGEIPMTSAHGAASDARS